LDEAEELLVALPAGDALEAMKRKGIAYMG
jgi:hypothetical protein